MKPLLLFIGILWAANYTQAQRFNVKLKNNEVVSGDRLIVTEPLFSNTPDIVIEGKRIRLKEIEEVKDNSLLFTYKTLRFRRRLLLARQLEAGQVNLYDFHSPMRRENAIGRQISSNNRFYYNHPGDTVVYVLNRKNFGKLFDSAFASYPDYQSIRKNYLRLHTAGIISVILLADVIIVLGFQNVAVLVSYAAVTTIVTGYSLINRQRKFNRVRVMVSEFNKQSQ